MSDFFPLNIFPIGSLASSVTTTVWVGTLVICFFNLRLGWVLSGLVVPGYLVPLLIAKPWAAVVVIIEGFITYFLVWFVSECLSHRAYWHNFFGRDRFFALVLCSIIVRLLLDGWLLPILGEKFNQYAQLNFDYRNNLHSFGLIIVSLIANQFWKTGFVRGLPPFFIVLGITFGITRYGLMEFTNYNVSNLSYLYEDISASILASSKAYIILVVTAFLASRMNLRYGWDFNGILIPSLLALQWYQPLKILVTLFETGFILAIGALVLRLPFLKKITIEGARKIILFFNISFLYKLALGYGIIYFAPSYKVSDFYGFGYLLATLMAIKIHDKGIFMRLTRATLQTSLVAVVVASFIGFGLTLLPWQQALQAETLTTEVSVKQVDANLNQLLRQDYIKLYKNKLNGTFVTPLPQELDVFSKAVSYLHQYTLQKDSRLLQQAAVELKPLNYQIILIKNRYLYLQENESRGWGSYVIDSLANNNFLVSIPAPLDEQNVMEAGLSLFGKMQARSLAIAGSLRKVKTDSSADVLSSPQTLFQAFHLALNTKDVLQVRGYTPYTARVLKGRRVAVSEVDLPQNLPSQLWIKNSIPDSLSLPLLKRMLESYEIIWDQNPLANQQREISNNGFAELFLSQNDIKKLIFKPLLLQQNLPALEKEQSLEGYLQAWLLENKTEIADKGSNLYIPPNQEDLLFFDEEILQPLLKTIEKDYQGQQWTADGIANLRLIASYASLFNYQVLRYRYTKTGQDYVVLLEQSKSQQKRYWGTYIIRLGKANNYIVQIPRPVYEANSFEYGVSLFERAQAKALLIAGANPAANIDKSSDILLFSNKVNLFNLVNQVLLRESKKQPLLVLQSRAFSYSPTNPLQTDVVLAMGKGESAETQLSPLAKQVYQLIVQDKLKLKFVDGSFETASYAVGNNTQMRYLKATENKEFAIIWLSPLTRASYRQQTESVAQEAQFSTLNISTITADLSDYIQEKQPGFAAQALPVELKNSLQAYTREQDIMYLVQIGAWKKQYPMTRLLDVNTQQTFLLIGNSEDKLIAIANLHPRTETVMTVNAINLTKTLPDFIYTRAQLLEITP